MPMTEEMPARASTPQQVIDALAWEEPANGYECRVLLCPEPEGGFSAHALRLPGVVSEGETEQEALDNIAEAFRGAIAAYRQGGDAIPWETVEIERTKGSLERWILVNV